jgi:hypothetical protein
MGDGSGRQLRHIRSDAFIRHPRRNQGIWLMETNTANLDRVWDKVTNLVRTQLASDGYAYEFDAARDQVKPPSIRVALRVEGYCNHDGIKSWMCTFVELGAEGELVYVDVGPLVGKSRRPRLIFVKLPDGPVREVTGLGGGQAQLKEMRLRARRHKTPNERMPADAVLETLEGAL